MNKLTEMKTLPNSDALTLLVATVVVHRLTKAKIGRVEGGAGYTYRGCFDG